MKAIQFHIFKSNERFCKNCSKVFFDTRKNMIFCGRECALKFHSKLRSQRKKEKYPVRKCLGCKKDITKKLPFANYCSTKCRRTHKRHNNPFRNPISDGHYVYVIGFQKKEGFYCKIGYTSKSNYHFRSKTLQTGCPEKLEKYLWFGPYDSYEIAHREEIRLQNLWDKTSADNEWVFISNLNEDWLRQQSTPEYFKRLEYVKQNNHLWIPNTTALSLN